MKYLRLYILLILFSNCKVDRKDFYLPENFSGEVAVLYTDNGTKPPFKQGRQKIYIPDSAIVFLNEKYVEGEIDYKYYIKTPRGFSELPEFIPGVETDNGKKYIYFARTMTINAANHASSQSSVFGHFFSVVQQLDSTASKNRFFFERKIEKMLHTHTNN